MPVMHRVSLIRPSPQYHTPRLWSDPKAVEWVARYRLAIQAGVKLPPIELQSNGFIVDGHHRWRAYVLENVEMAPIVFRY